MKKLNRKGFTLVELLAVIVILAIVVGISLVTILPTLEKSREKSFEVAVDAIRTYIQEQTEMALLSGDLHGVAYNAEVATCPDEPGEECNGRTGDLLVVTGYEKNISEIKWVVNNGVVKITCATANPNGDYRQGKSETSTKACD